MRLSPKALTRTSGHDVLPAISRGMLRGRSFGDFYVILTSRASEAHRISRIRPLLAAESCDVHLAPRGLCGCGLFRLHRFPQDDDERRRWMANVNRKNFVPSESSRVCSEHFISGTRTSANPTPVLKLGYELKARKETPLSEIHQDSSPVALTDELQDDIENACDVTVWLESSVEADSELQMTLSEGDDDGNATEAPVPTPSEVLDAIDLLRRYAGAFEGMEAALNALATYEKCMAPLLLTSRPQP